MSKARLIIAATILVGGVVVAYKYADHRRAVESRERRMARKKKAA